MTTPRKAPIRVQVPDPQPTYESAPTGPAEASAAPSAVLKDPGPPPAMPAWPGSVPLGSVQDRLRQAAAARDREALRAVSTLREPPAAAHYRAELLHWLDEVEAYEAVNK